MTFIVLSFVIRFIQANGNAGFVTASFAIIANEFPDSVARAIVSHFTQAYTLLNWTSLNTEYLKTIERVAVVHRNGCRFGFDCWTRSRRCFVRGKTQCGTVFAGRRSRRRALMFSNVSVNLLSIPTVTLAVFSIFAAPSAIGYLFPTLEPHVNSNVRKTSLLLTCPHESSLLLFLELVRTQLFVFLVLLYSSSYQSHSQNSFSWLMVLCLHDSILAGVGCVTSLVIPE